MMPALPFATALAVGVGVGYYAGFIPLWVSLLLVGVFILAGICVRNYPKLRYYPLILAFVFAGVFFMARAKHSLSVNFPEDYSTIEATMLDSPNETKRFMVSTFYVHDGILSGHKLRCYVNKEYRPYLNLGATYQIKGRVVPFENFTSDANFDYKRWADSQSLSGQVFVYEGGIRYSENRVENLPYFERIAVKSKMLRSRVLKCLSDTGISVENYALLSAMAFGDRSLLSRETQDIYARTGVAHLLALSGMNLSILFVLLSFLLIGRHWQLFGKVAVFVSIWLYVVLVGMPASIVRAGTMISIYIIATLDGRDKMSVNALFVTVMFMLLVNPMIVWDVGFQLSFISMLSIFAFYKPVYEMFDRKFLFASPLARAVWGMVSMSLAAQIGTTPLVLYYFGRFPTYFLITNIVAIPLTSILLYGVFVLLLVSWIPFLKWFMVVVMDSVSYVLDISLTEIDSWRGASIDNVSINGIQLLLVYIMLGLLTILVSKLYSILSRLH